MDQRWVMPVVDTLLKRVYIDQPLDSEYVRDPSFESLWVIMDAGRAASHLRRYLRSRLEYYAVKLAFLEAANPQRVPRITSLFGLPRARLRNLERGRFQYPLGLLSRSNLSWRQWVPSCTTTPSREWMNWIAAWLGFCSRMAELW
jgi:hypothetical protein